MFPVDSRNGTYDAPQVGACDALVADRDFGWEFIGLPPEVLPADARAGELIGASALLLNPMDTLKPGISLCPPGGDTGIGMVAADSIVQRTNNISCGTSVSLTVVLERVLSRLHTEVDMVTTPDASSVTMVHSDNGASKFDVWIDMSMEFTRLAGIKPGVS